MHTKKLKISYESNDQIKNVSKLELLKQYENLTNHRINNNSLTPTNFHEQWMLLKQMRSKNDAPVDTMGASSCPDQSESKATYKFQSLVSLLLSSQTKDQITYSTMEKLINHGLSIENIISTDEEILKKLIYGVSFHNNKARYIKMLAEKIKENYDSDPPEDLKEVLTLPGIGKKMAFIYLQECCGKVEGIAVDTHVHRICNRLKWVNETKTPEQTRLELERWLDKEYWTEINVLLVGFGQTICKAVNPLCEECLINKTCEYGRERDQVKRSKGSKSKSPKNLKRKSSKVHQPIKRKKK